MITDSNILSKILPGITAKDLENILNNDLKINILTNLINASLSNDIDLTSYQVLYFNIIIYYLFLNKKICIIF